MTDTSLLVALYSTTDANHERAVALVRDIHAGQMGAAYLTDYVLAEVLNYFVARSRNRDRPEEVVKDVLGESQAPWLLMARIDEGTWHRARERFRVLSRAGLSFTDCTTLMFAERHSIEGIVSFDSGFDGLFARIH